ncbi:MAG: ADP-forming succinate--CoA ligase subunit beta [Flavobacteriales bacterium]|jgi:succinyl-CoA synthetase beta subunit|nr:ADP-forming succinate--CoA ligase subunit beta [Flavobacteriales bacterium]|tara:strand:- start:7829 stop:9019 length:1191 start_codon:yes stop_codon:yes gene_type:complete
MNLHEYQGKEILSQHGVRVQRGYVAEKVSEAVSKGKQLLTETNTPCFIVKAQIHAGGRGKGGGVKLAKNLDELEHYSNEILGMMLITPQTSKEGKKVRKIFIGEDVYYPGKNKIEELYISVLLDRTTNKNMVMYSSEGGVEIEQVAEETPDKIFIEKIDPIVGITDLQLQTIATNLNLSNDAFDNMCDFIKKLYTAYLESDASLFEINPVIKSSDNKIIAVDAKVTLDDNALFRHPDFIQYRDEYEEDPLENEAASVGLSYVKLDGNVGCIVNGAGLAMATMDIIKHSGGNPANFLDVGGTADAKRVEAALRIILNDNNVKAILVNIFGGIVRCDRVAQGIVDAYKNIGSIDVPIIVRLQGTNAVEAKEIIDNSGLEVISAISLQSAADKVKNVFA